MTDNKTECCVIPVQCVMRKGSDGTYKMFDPVYKEIPAEVIAEYLIKHCGAEVLKGGDK